MTGIIYKITNPKGLVYIGQTKDLKNRIKFYRLGHCRKQFKVMRSINKYGWESHTLQIIHEIEFDKKELNRLEILEVSRYDSYKNGLNLTPGGTMISDYNISKIKEASKNRIISPETRAKISKTLTGKKHSPETILKRTLAIRGLKRSPESRKRISDAKKGVKLSEAHVQAIRNVIRKPKSEELKQKHREIMLKAPYKFNPSKKVIDTSTNEVFDSLKSLCEKLGYTYSYIQERLNNRVYNHTNFRWLCSM